MDPDPRHETERRKWDAHAHASLPRLEDLRAIPPGTTFRTYTTGRLLLDGMADFLGDLDGREVLEYGCGLGELTIVLARSGARVTAFDLSSASVDVSRRRAEREGVADRVSFLVAAGESLPFPDGSFDLAVGKAVLHHLEPAAAARELVRVLRPGGRAAFSEPLGMNPLLVFARAHLPYPGKHERGADRPLTRADLDAWRAPFERVRMHPVQLLSMVERALGFGHPIGPLRTLDRLLLRRWPGLGRFCRYGILLFETSGAAVSVGVEAGRAGAGTIDAGVDVAESGTRPPEEVRVEQPTFQAPNPPGSLEAGET
ncbi:MAG TPA: class I SAM-dependent methyltransferase [Candidatus Limnocylindrales bacterium]|nr:class I SAM-dependent methyltransferase [Candidatus Limnocylindrales bacterium]